MSTSDLAQGRNAPRGPSILDERESEPGGEVPGASPSKTPARPSISLSALMSIVGGQVSLAFPEPIWITAEVVEYKRTPAGHVYIELIERDESDASKAKAKLRANIWRSTVDPILNKFKKATDSELRAGMKVLLKVRVAVSPVYSLALVIVDIDPAFTVGAMAAHVAAIRRRLADEGIFERNKRLMMPKVLTRVTVIAPDGAAGLGDFKREADILSAFKVAEFTYITAVFQGENASSTISLAFGRAATTSPDVIVVIRGGGATSDLQYLNDYSIAKEICLASVPVVIGIGHEKDKTVLDEVAHTSMGTPSKVIGFLASILKEEVRRVQDAMKSIQQSAQLAVSRKQEQILKHISSIRNASTVIALRYQQRSGEHIRQICMQAKRSTQQRQQQLSQLIGQVEHDANRVANERRNSLRMLFREIYGQRAEKTLARGFAMVADVNGKLVTSVGGATEQDELRIVFHDGSIKVEYKK